MEHLEPLGAVTVDALLPSNGLVGLAAAVTRGDVG
jgi:hypothetical protein